MGSIRDVENLLDIDLTDKKLRDGRCKKNKNQYYRFDDYLIVKLTKESYMVVDNNKQVRRLLRKYTYYCSSPHNYASRQTNEGGKYFHQLITNYQKGLVNDHINRNRLDNRRANIRITTYSINSRNKNIRSDCKTGITGVRLVKNLKKYKHYYLADCISLDRTRLLKTFSVKVYGEKKAKEMAIAQRNLWKVMFDYKN